MALTYNSIDLRGSASKEVLGTLFYENGTLYNGYVAFEDSIKANTIFTEYENDVVLQAYTAGNPTSQGGVKLKDTLITPVKVMKYFEFNPETLRSSRFGQSMQKGAWNIMSTEFEQKVLANYAPSISEAMEHYFWGSVTSDSKTAIAALTGATTQEKAVIAAQADGLFDGVIAKLIKGQEHQKVSGTTITSANIAAEYAKAYAQVANAKLDGNGPSKSVIYAPLTHKSLVNIANVSATYRDIFTKADGKFYYLDLEIRFVPMPSNNIIVIGKEDRAVWCTDLESDFNTVVIDKIAANREDMFLKAIMTLEAHVANLKNWIVYVG